MSIAGELVTERFKYDGGRRVTVYVPPDPPEAIVFAGDGQLISQWGGVLETAAVPSTMIIVDGTAAVSRTPPHCDIGWPSPANTIASGGSGGTYTVTRRPPSYLNRSVTSSPAMDIVAVSLSVAQPAAFAGGAAGGFIVADPVAAGESAEAAFEAGAEPAGELGGTGCCQRPRAPRSVSASV